MFVDIYAIQTVPSSNINRDDTGNPKSALFGGVYRARVSSQAWKRAIRSEFLGLLDKKELGVRTKLAAELIADAIIDKRPDLSGDAVALAAAALNAAGIAVEASKRSGDDEGKPSTKYLVFISRAEIENLADVAITWWDKGDEWKSAASKQMKKDVAPVLHGFQGIEIALFGRMLADAPDLNVDACCQVAHAISVDAVTQEYDYFTAVDDCAADDNAGAGMIGTVGFNSSTLYRYATIDTDSLTGQLGSREASARAVTAFVEAFVRAMPTGKQNTFANRTIPNAVMVSVRDRQPVNLVSAFECPVRASSSESVSRRASELLGERAHAVEEMFGVGARAAWNVVDGDPVERLNMVSKHVSLREMLEELGSELLAGE